MIRDAGYEMHDARYETRYGIRDVGFGILASRISHLASSHLESRIPYLIC